MDSIADEAEEAAKSHHMKTLYGLTKTLCNERQKRSSAILDKDGNLLSCISWSHAMQRRRRYGRLKEPVVKSKKCLRECCVVSGVSINKTRVYRTCLIW